MNLLQLASNRGVCILIRLSKFDTIPTELQVWYYSNQSIKKKSKNLHFNWKEILEDKTILKVGERVSFNVDRLEGDYGIHVASAIDLRELAIECKCPSNDLDRLSEIYLNISIQTLDWRVINSDWKKVSLREEIKYAAKTVHVAIELFKFFEKKLVADKYSGDRIKFVDELCQKTNHDWTCTLPDQEIRIVSNTQECKAVVEQLRMYAYY